MLILISLLVLFNPPRRWPERGILLVLAGFLGLFLLGFAPANWVTTPQWRQDFVNSGGILPDTLSAQPWLSFEGLVLFCGAALWLCWLNAQVWPASVRAGLIRGFGAGVVFFAVLALVLNFWKANPPFWAAPQGFGPFPNRNHTSDFLALGGIVALACAHDRWRHRGPTCFFWIAGWATILAALVTNGSRAGIVLLLGGAAGWLALLCWFSGSKRRFAIVASVFVILFSVFLLFGGGLLDRFKNEFGPQQGFFGFRGLIFRDTLRMISDSPWLGVGVGNFRPVFSAFRQDSVVGSVINHPESDWLWLAAELGWSGLVFISAGVFLLLARAFPFRSNTERHLRACAWVAAVAFALHGFVDVAGHRLGAALPAIFLACVAAGRGPAINGIGSPSEPAAQRHSISPASSTRRSWVPWAFRLAALPSLSIGILWIWATLAQSSVPGTIGIKLAKTSAARSISEGRFNDAAGQLTAALRWAPLDWQLYLQRAAAHAYGGRWTTALTDFRLARRLQPFLAEVPLAEGRVWLNVRPALALPVWEEALRRAEPAAAPQLYAAMLSLAPADVRFRKTLRAMSDGRPALQVVYLTGAAPDEAAAMIRALRQTDPNLASLSIDERAAVFDAWARSPAQAELFPLLEQNNEWRAVGWRHLVRHYARQQNFQRACETAFAYLPVPAVPQPVTSRDSPGTLRRRVLTNTADFASAYALYLAELDAGAIDDALAILERTREQANRPAYFPYLAAKLHANRGEWPEAWKSLSPLLPDN